LRIKNASRRHLLTGWRRLGGGLRHPEMEIEITRGEDDIKQLKCCLCSVTWAVFGSFGSAKESAADHFESAHRDPEVTDQV
jgi:hypothetical protein